MKRVLLFLPRQRRHPHQQRGCCCRGYRSTAAAAAASASISGRAAAPPVDAAGVVGQPPQPKRSMGGGNAFVRHRPKRRSFATRDTATIATTRTRAAPTPPTTRMMKTITRRCFVTSSSSSSSAPSSSPEKKGDDTDPSSSSSDSLLLYESPLGNVVTRLRTVSLISAICGSLGLPLVVAIKGGDLPSTGLLAVGMTFCAGTVGSTAIIQFCFGPYVYRIERIPVRKCRTTKKTTSSENQQPERLEQELTPLQKKNLLYKVTTRTLFLRQVETVFDLVQPPPSETTSAEEDAARSTRDGDVDAVGPYRGMRPLANLSVNGVPYYVHTEYLYHEPLRRAMGLKTETNATDQKDDNEKGEDNRNKKNNPSDDDFF